MEGQSRSQCQSWGLRKSDRMDTRIRYLYSASRVRVNQATDVNVNHSVLMKVSSLKMKAFGPFKDALHPGD